MGVSNYTSTWSQMGFSAVDVKGTPNRQSKVPGMGQDQHTCTQAEYTGAPNDQGQDDKSLGVIGLGGISDNIPGHTVRLDPCAKAAQDSGSSQMGFQGIAGPLNRGTPDWSGTRAQEVVKAGDQSENAVKSVDGVTTPTGRRIDGSNPDQGVAAGLLFPNIIE